MKKMILLTQMIPIILIGTSVQAQVNTGISPDFEEKVPAWLAEYHVPAVGIGIVEDGEIRYSRVFGELQKGVPAPDNTIFNVASMTKPVVAMLTLKLIEAGKWDLDEPLFHYWVDPDVADDPRHKKLTTRHVLSHKTGFPNWRDGKLEFEFEPGTQWRYSGEGFQYLRKALENKFNESLAELSDSFLFGPLGMTDTRYFWDENMDESRFACWHNANGEIYKPANPRGKGVNAAASLLSTIEDLCTFCIDVINGAGLSPGLYNDMISPQAVIRDNFAKGLGWELAGGLPGGEYALEHSGSNHGVKSIFIVLPESKRAIVVLTNGDNGVFVYNNIIRESFDIGGNILAGIHGLDNPGIVTLPEEILEKYTGLYLDSHGRNLTIARKDTILSISGNGVPTVTLYAETENKFFLLDFDVQFEFVKDDSLVITANGKFDCHAIKITHPPIVTLSDEVLEKYVGTYVRADNNSDIHVLKEGDKLILSGETVPVMELCPITENKFIAKDYVFVFEFIVGESDEITNMNVSGNGQLLCETNRIN